MGAVVTKPRKNIPNPTPRRVREIIATVSEGLTAMVRAGDNYESAFSALAETLSKIPDALAHPLYQKAFARGMAIAVEGKSFPDDIGTMLPEMLKLMRTAAGMTQTELAQAIGVSQGNVTEWESGDRPIPAHRLAAIRRAIGSYQVAA